jgi:hypothetical protein
VGECKSGADSTRWLSLAVARRVRAQGKEDACARRPVWLPFLPDAYFEVHYPNGDIQCAVIEIDMGTLTLRRFARKVQAFETALDEDVFRRHFKRDEFEVLVLTTSTRRLEALRHVAARVVPGGRHDLYQFATSTCCRGRRSTVHRGSIWTA